MNHTITQFSSILLHSKRNILVFHACRRHLASNLEYTWDCGITWLANEPTGWVSRPSVWFFTPWMCHSCFLLGFSVATICFEWQNKTLEKETLVIKRAGHKPCCFVFSHPIYSNKSLLGKGSKWVCAISVWILISAFLVKIKGHLEVLRDAVIWSVPLLEFLSRSMSFCPSLSFPFHLSSSFLSVVSCCLSLKLPLLFFLSLYLIHWSCPSWTVS